MLTALDPADGEGFVICLFRRLSGIPCPGCGLTRAFLHLLGGDLVGSLRLHPAALVLAVELAIAWLVWGWRLGGGASGRIGRPWVAPLAAAHAVALIGLWIGRLASGALPS